MQRSWCERRTSDSWRKGRARVSAACPTLGFLADLRLRPDLGEPTVAALRDAFAVEVIAPRGLTYRGIPRGEGWSLVVCGEAGQATAADREAVLAWACARPEIVRGAAGPIVDLNDT
ncbi:hypothetical protein BH09GEM1_BH09GEM1_47160 [soil metagenome]